MLIKHARLTPLCGDAFVDAFRKTTLPPDLVASIHVDHATVSRLIDRRAVDFISFTGSVDGGREVYKQASGQLLDMGLELGGKDPALVCEDANFDFAVANLVDGAFYNAGQSCCAIERIYVMRPLFSKFVDAYVAEVEKYKVGNPEDPAHRYRPARPAQGYRLHRISDQTGRGTRRPGAHRRQARARPRLLLPTHRAPECGPHHERHDGGELRAR